MIVKGFPQRVLRPSQLVCLSTFALAILAATKSQAGDAYPSLRSYYFDGGNDSPSHSANLYDPSAGSLSNGYSGTWGGAFDTVSYDSATINVHAAGQASPSRSGYSEAYGQFQDSVTFNNSSYTGQTGTADFTYHLSGDMGWTGNFGTAGVTAWVISVDGTAAYQDGNTSYFNGTSVQISDLSSFTISRPITFGSALGTSMKLEGLSSPGSNDISTHIELTLTLGSVTVKNSNGDVVSYSSTANSGDAQSVPISTGSTYNGFTLTNTSGVSTHHSTVSLLGGTASGNGTLTATFLGQPSNATVTSDAVDISGTGSDLHVVEMNYDEAAVLAESETDSSQELLWFNPATGTWMNSVLGDSDGGATSQAFTGAYNPATEFVLGDYGVDTVNHTVWAVVDHSSEFAAGVPAPEPGTAMLLAGPLGFLAGVGRFRRGRRG